MLKKDMSLLRPMVLAFSFMMSSSSVRLRCASSVKLPLKIQHLRLLVVWLGVLKCLAIGRPCVLRLMDDMWLLNRSLKRVFVSPM